MKNLASLLAVALLSTAGMADVITTTSTGVSQFRLVGAATENTTGVNLTPNAPLQGGAAWLRDRQAVVDGFNIAFDYRLDLPSASALATGEGLAFVIQNAGPTAIGGPAMGVSVTGLQDAVAVVLRTGTVNRLEIRQSGPNGINFSDAALASRAVTNAEIRQMFGNNALQGGGRLAVSYVPGTLSVALNGRQMISAAVDLGTIADENGGAYIGWTAATSQFRADSQTISNIGLTFVPTPGAAALLGIGGLAAARRRR